MPFWDSSVQEFVFEIIGIAASLIVCISLCMKNIKNLRIVNLAGSLVFLVYGFLIGSLAVMSLNGFSTAVNVYYLLQMRRNAAKEDIFDVLFVASLEDDILRRFVRFHSEDIIRFYPSFDPDLKNGTLVEAECCFILRETLPVSLVAYRRNKDEELMLLVDYVIPAFRDFRNSRFFFSNVVNRIAAPGSVFTARGETKAHIHYLKRMGFVETGREGKTVCFRKAIQ